MPTAGKTKRLSTNVMPIAAAASAASRIRIPASTRTSTTAAIPTIMNPSCRNRHTPNISRPSAQTSRLTRRSRRQSGRPRSAIRWASVGTIRYAQIENGMSFQMNTTKVPVEGTATRITAAIAVHRPGTPRRRNAKTV